MKTAVNHSLLAIALACTTAGAVIAAEEAPASQPTVSSAINLPAPKEGEYVHNAPRLDELADSGLHPELQKAIRRGHDLFVNTQQLRGTYTYNDLTCANCHLGEGRHPFSGPVWPAVTTLPDYRGKNDQVNNLEERIAGCFAFSMNGIPPAYGSDEMVALTSYLHWLAKGAPVYGDGNNMYGRGYPEPVKPELEPDADRGEVVFNEHCVICHGADGQGMKDGTGRTVFPPLWGDASYNWGAGIARVFTLAGFVKHNMPYGQPGKLTDQQAWDVAQFVNTHERPQDPRFEGSAVETRERYLKTFHRFTMYGTEFKGKILGENATLGGKPVLKPESLRPRNISGTPSTGGAERPAAAEAAPAEAAAPADAAPAQ